MVGLSVHFLKQCLKKIHPVANEAYTRHDSFETNYISRNNGDGSVTSFGTYTAFPIPDGTGENLLANFLQTSFM